MERDGPPLGYCGRNECPPGEQSDTRMENQSVNESSYRPTREAVFTETMQIANVVRDLDATLRRYVDDYGIGPWQEHEFNPGDAEDLRANR